jgi:hypothetical protein
MPYLTAWFDISQRIMQRSIRPTHRPMESSIFDTGQMAHGMNKLPAHTDNIIITDNV